MLYPERIAHVVKTVKRAVFKTIRRQILMSNGIKGGIDGVSRGCVNGWLAPLERVYVRAGNQTLGSFLPNAPRPDVVAAGICADPLVGIAYRIDGEMLQNHEAIGFFVKRNDKWIALPGSPVNLSECRSNARGLAGLLASPPFVITSAERCGDSLCITGLLIPKTRSGPLNLELRVNGEPFGQIDWSEPRQDRKDYFWFLGPLGRCQFNATVAGAQLNGVSALRLEAVDAETGQPVNPYQFHEIPLEPMPANLPDAKAQMRVLGWADDLLFWTTGRDHMRAIVELVAKYRGHVNWRSSCMLDWGCGCGRISRQFMEDKELHPGRLVGVDIDPVNIQWCKENLKGAEFHLTGLLPPLPFAAESFDFIHGNSVFTHLNLKNQDLWLAELRRVLKTDGIAVVTINSSSALAFGSAGLPFISDWRRNGIYFPGHNANLDEVIDNHDYYMDTFHTHEYVAAHWNRFFDVLGIHEMVFGYQDAVILRKRSS
jgi:SAM-dependent methyltransferase